MPFKMKLERKPGCDEFLESYVGVYLSVTYDLIVDVKFVDSVLEKIQSQFPIYIQVSGSGK